MTQRRPPVAPTGGPGEDMERSGAKFETWGWFALLGGGVGAPVLSGLVEGMESPVLDWALFGLTGIPLFSGALLIGKSRTMQRPDLRRRKMRNSFAGAAILATLAGGGVILSVAQDSGGGSAGGVTVPAVLGVVAGVAAVLTLSYGIGSFLAKPVVAERAEGGGQ